MLRAMQISLRHKGKWSAYRLLRHQKSLCIRIRRKYKRGFTTDCKWQTISRNVRPKILRFQHPMKCNCKCLEKRLVHWRFGFFFKNHLVFDCEQFSRYAVGNPWHQDRNTKVTNNVFVYLANKKQKPKKVLKLKKIILAKWKWQVFASSH